MSAPQVPASFAETFENARRMDAPVNERLRIIADAARRLSPDYGRAVDELAARLNRLGAYSHVPDVGQQMPGFLLPDDRGTLVDLESLICDGPVAIVFHRGSWCPFCRMNTIALAEAHHSARAIGARIVAISPDLRKFSSALQSQFQVPFPLLTDVDNGYAMSLGLVIWLGDAIYSITANGRRDDPRFNGDEGSMLPIPATFVVRCDGTISARHIDPDYRRRMEIADLLDALRAAK